MGGQYGRHVAPTVYTKRSRFRHNILELNEESQQFVPSMSSQAARGGLYMGSYRLCNPPNVAPARNHCPERTLSSLALTGDEPRDQPPLSLTPGWPGHGDNDIPGHL